MRGMTAGLSSLTWKLVWDRIRELGLNVGKRDHSRAAKDKDAMQQPT